MRFKKCKVVCFILFVLLIIPTLTQAKGIVTITFDDGSPSCFTYAYPYMSKHNMNATLYVISKPLQQKDKYYLQLSQLKVLQEEGWEIGSHSVSHPFMTSLSDKNLEIEVRESKEVLKNMELNIQSFATPNGNYDYRVVNAIKKYYGSHRNAWSDNNGFNDLSNIDPYNIHCVDVDHPYTVGQIVDMVNEAAQTNKWLVLLFHRLVLEKPKEYEFNKNNFERVIDYVNLLRNDQQIEVKNVTEVLKIYGGGTDEKNSNYDNHIINSIN